MAGSGVISALRVNQVLSGGFQETMQNISLTLGMRIVLTGRVKRVFRSLWVLAANGILVRLLFSQLFGEPFNRRAAQSPELWLEFLLKAIVPVLGIVLELAGWRFAKWVNVGYFTLLGSYYCAGAVWWWSDPFHGVLLILGSGLLIVAGLTELVYRFTLLES